MSFKIEYQPEAIRAVKKNLRSALPNYGEVFRDVETEIRHKVTQIIKEREAGEPVIPAVNYSETERGVVSPEAIVKIRDRGACVIRNVFEPKQARAWDDEIGRYVEENGLYEKLAHAAEDKPAFLVGRTPPDFAPDDFEVDFKGRGTEADLSPLGRSQMGLPLSAGA